MQLLIFTFFCSLFIACYANEPKDFYKIYSSGNLIDINKYSDYLETLEPSSQINAYKGALLMKKAGFEKEPAQKLRLFKTGHKLLETEIAKSPENTEYRFLRLTIQESAPAILKYNINLQDDKEFIVRNFKDLGLFLQSQVIEYSKTSKVLDKKYLQ